MNERNDLNPYAAPPASSMDSAEPASPSVQVKFSGEVTKTHLAGAYFVDKVAIRLVFFATLAVSLPVSVYLVLTGKRAFALWEVIAWWAIALAVPMVLLVSYPLYRAVQYVNQFDGRLRVRRPVNFRPWLLGPVHGTFSAAFTTIWYREVGIQLVSQDLLGYLSPNAYVVRANRQPFAIVPSVCFWESDWHEVLETLNRRQPGFLLPIPPPSNAFVCTLLSGRLSFLEARLRGFRWGFSEGGSTWLVAALITMVGWPWIERSLPDWAYFVAIPLLVLLFYILRIAIWTWHTGRQFANESRGYLAIESTNPERVVNWFNGEVVFWSNGRMWIHMPVQFIDQVQVGFSSIEFTARGVSMQFHREGFRDESEWRAACDKAGQLLSSLDSVSESR